MARIRITPEQVRQASQQFHQPSQQMVQTLTNTLNGMHSEWEGMTQQRFYGEFEQWS
ncbi:MAG: WXG100 family type VII secretion target [Chloroflexota bacterium]|nr:WXG100 family type VII secretion target [Chloroflexota bacterium]